MVPVCHGSISLPVNNLKTENQLGMLKFVLSVFLWVYFTFRSMVAKSIFLKNKISLCILKAVASRLHTKSFNYTYYILSK